jgi:GT2 family glycosyltransferase
MTQIVVLNWNSCEMTANCLRSLLAMRGEQFTIVVIDNGSSDGSVEYLRDTFPQVQVIAQPCNLGFAAGCNVGMGIALDSGTEYVLLVNNDTQVDPEMLEELLCEARKNPAAAMVSPKIFYYNPPDIIWWAGGRYSLWRGLPSHVGRHERNGPKLDEPCAIEWATGCVLLLRSEALRQVGMFDERIFGNGEDLDLSLRLLKYGWTIRYAPRARVWHKEGVDYRRNVGEHARKFTASRNLLWIMHKHGSRCQWLTFLPHFFGYLVLMVAQSVYRGDLKSARATVSGVRAYLKMRRDPRAIALPAELVRSRRSA